MSKKFAKNQNSNSAFTIVEIATSIVIISLIVAGIFAAQNLLLAAESRQVISMNNKLNQAFVGFYEKYEKLPGDINFTNASFFFGADAINPSGDEDGFIFATDAREVILTYYYLNKANLLNEVASSTITHYQPGINIPKLDGLDVGIGIRADDTANEHFWHYGFTDDSEFVAAGVFADNAFSPIVAYNIDKKIDNGLPNTGSVLAFGPDDPRANNTGNTGPGPYVFQAATYSTSEKIAACTTGDALNLELRTYKLDSTAVSCSISIAIPLLTN